MEFVRQGINVPYSHMPGRGHRRKSEPISKKRFGKKKKNEHIDAWKRYWEIQRQWEVFSDFHRKMLPENNPNNFLPKGEPPTMNERHTLIRKLDTLCDKVNYWLYERNAPKYAKNLFYCILESTLNDLVEYKLSTAIFVKEGYALLYELAGDYENALSYREREMKLMAIAIDTLKEYKTEDIGNVATRYNTETLLLRRDIANKLNGKIKQADAMGS